MTWSLAFTATITQEQEHESELHKAARAGDAQRVSRLLEEGSDPAVMDARGRPPYLVAANKVRTGPDCLGHFFV